MSILIIIFGALTLLAGMVIIANPEAIFGLLEKHIEKLWLQVVAVAVRLLLGILLIYLSSVSKYPIAIEIIGWLSIVAASVIALMGSGNFNRLIAWVLNLTRPIGRIGGVLAVIFGAFLIYAFI
jgi:hypothetical protein